MIRFAPGSQCLTFSAFGWFWKLGLSSGSRKGLNREKKGEKSAKLDLFWSEYLLPGMFCGQLIKIARIGVSTSSKNQMAALNAHLKNHISNAKMTDGTWRDCFGNLNLIFKNMELEEGWLKKLFAMEKFTSVHGDLCASNVLMIGGEIRLVDWAGFRPSFWACYDLMHMDVVEAANSNGSSWKSILIEWLDTKKIDRDTAARYAISRCELEVEQDKALGRLTSQRKQKYSTILSEICR